MNNRIEMDDDDAELQRQRDQTILMVANRISDHNGGFGTIRASGRTREWIERVLRAGGFEVKFDGDFAKFHRQANK